MRTLINLMMIVGVLAVADARAAIDFTPARKIVSCGPNTVYFAYNNDIVPDQIFWDFGDGTSASGVNPSHTYTSYGVYSVKLVVIKHNVRDSVMKDSLITINPAPVAQMQITKVSNMETNKFLFTSSSVHHADSFVKELWTVGTDSLEGDTVVYQFGADGEYTITLQVTNNKACMAESSTTVRIKNNDILPLGVAKWLTSQALLYPNPAREVLHVELPGVLRQPGFTIVDISGREHRPETAWQAGRLAINTSGLAPGAYQLVFDAGSERAARRFVVAE